MEEILSPSLANMDTKKAYDIRIIPGTSNPTLVQDICQILEIPPELANIGKFADGEIQIELETNVRGSDTFIIQPTCPPYVNDALMELLLLIDTLSRSSAKRITVVIPYFGYARQDQKAKSRVPISASVVASMIEKLGPQRVVTVDLHCGQIQGFFHKTPVDNLFAINEMIKYLQKNWILYLGELEAKNLAIVSPDAGGVPRANSFAEKIKA